MTHKSYKSYDITWYICMPYYSVIQDGMTPLLVEVAVSVVFHKCLGRLVWPLVMIF